MLVIKLIINTTFIYIKPIDAVFTTFERDLERSVIERDLRKQRVEDDIQKWVNLECIPIHLGSEQNRTEPQ